ncbi:hypothetical protein CU669_15490 [Paramagnetospirillum kuznetsovii]|uniref:Lipoprotein n=1 Tax=Paramagnetospirillum kuznetsovii TaxID=2053833 RepID=A0A364NVP9_9PROT|nr:hypothetical protein [Paramagnetospirillum kuznetsovii]RAU20987.1 hypothetical protein CU669_15490 [Paramagnetospirillum kuznetsovii]
MRFSMDRATPCGWKKLTVLAVALVLTACANGKVSSYGKIDHAEMTAIVPPGHYGIIGALKEALIKEGWKVIVSAGDEKFIGKVIPEIDITRTRERSSRYTFTVEQHVWNVCAAGENAVEYDITIVDNRSGSEVASITGRGDCWAGRNDAQISKAIGAL